MTLPPQDQSRTYTEAELQHLVAREWAKNAIIQLQGGQAELQKQLVELNSTFISEVRAFREALTSLPGLIASQIRDCRTDLRREIENDFPNNIEAMRMEQRIEDKIGATDTTLGKQISALDRKVDSLESKVDKQWLKITVVVGTIVALGGLVQWLIATGQAIS